MLNLEWPENWLFKSQFIAHSQNITISHSLLTINVLYLTYRYEDM